MSQFLDVISVCKGVKWWTLREIESECYKRFGKYHTQCAISARLRDAARLQRMGLMKERRDPLNMNSKLYQYRIVTVNDND